jgi:hypothetical protein
MRQGELVAIAIFLFCISGFLLVSMLIGQDKHVPPRRNALVREVALMAEECQWENGRMTLLDGLRCVRGKIDGRVKDLEERE